MATPAVSQPAASSAPGAEGVLWALAVRGFDLQWLTLVIAAVLVAGGLAAKPLAETMAASA